MAWAKQTEAGCLSEHSELAEMRRGSQAKYHDRSERRPGPRKRILSTTNKDIGEDDLNAYLMIGATLENTGAHGIPNIIRASSPQRRLLWCFLFLSGVSFFLWQGVVVISRYLDFGVNVHLDIRYAMVLELPAITVCNMNSIYKASVSNFSKELETVLELSGDEQTTSTYVPGMHASTVTGNRGTVFSATKSKQMYQDFDNVNFGDEDDRVVMLESAVTIIGNASYQDRFQTGHSLDDMMLSCYFENFPCDPSNFTRFYNYLYGNCYTFNSGAMESPLSVSKIGPLYGLSLEMYIEQDEYIYDIQPSAGLRLIIHDQHEMPFPEEQGINVAPGAHTSVGMSLVDIRRKEAPYTNCSSSSFKENNIFKDQFPFLEYSRSACEKDCYFKAVLETCHCADAKYRYNTSLPICDTTNTSTDSCVDRVDLLYTMGMIPCNCTMPCSQRHYEHVVSEAEWPNKGYESEVIDGIEEISDALRRKIETDDDFIGRNVVKFTVYYDNLQYQYISQTAAYDWYSLVSDLGGQIGLWIGVSILTIFEFIELVYDLIKLCFLKIMDPSLRKKKKNCSKPPRRNDVMALDIKHGGHDNTGVTF